MQGTRDRVAYIQNQMERGVWAPLVARELAAAWGVSLSRVRQLSQTAHLRLTEGQTPEERAQKRDSYIGKLEAFAVLDARRGNMREARKHLQLAAQMQGLLVHRHQHQVSADREFDAWTDEELKRFLDTGEVPKRGAEAPT